jgi:Tol biopolymer transport system component
MDNFRLKAGCAVIFGLALGGCGGGGETGNTPAGGTNQLSGTLVAPVGTQVTLQNNGGDNLSVTTGAFGADDYSSQTFTFTTAQASGSSYLASLLSKPANQTCSVYKGASGTLPVASGALKVGCEYNYDMVSRSTDDSVISYAANNQSTAIGGASVAVGTTSSVYGEGRFVVFVSSMPGLVQGATGMSNQVYWRDRMDGSLILVSSPDGGNNEGQGNSTNPSISADGLTVVFESDAFDLVANDNNGVKDVFVWSAMTNTVERASVSDAGVEGDAASSEPVVSGDGKVVAFTTYASNLGGTVAGTTNPNVYRRVLATGTNTLVSHANASASEGNFGSSRPSISEDGTRIAFWSYASDLVAGDTDGIWDIFVYDSSSGYNTLVSYANGGALRNAANDSSGISSIFTPTISGNGRYVAYASPASDLVTGDTGGWQDVFVVDTQTSSVVRASVSSSEVQADGNSATGTASRIALSYDGNLVAFATSATNLGTASADNIVIRNISAGTTSVVTATGGWAPSYVSMSRTGAYVNFLSSATGLDTRFTNSGVYTRFTGIGRAWAWVD